MFQQSESIAELATAFAAFQAEIKNPSFDAKNPFFGSEYVTLAGLQEHYRPILAAHDLTITQHLGPVRFDGEHFVTSCVTQLQHVSGQWQRSLAECVVKRTAARDDKVLILVEGRPIWLTTPQDCGGADSYLQRYAYMAVIGVRGEKDDDGNAASGIHAHGPGQARPQAPSKPAQPSALDRARAQARQPVDPPAVDSGGSVVDSSPEQPELSEFVPVEAVNELVERMKAAGWDAKRIDAFVPNPLTVTDQQLDQAIEALKTQATPTKGGKTVAEKLAEAKARIAAAGAQ